MYDGTSGAECILGILHVSDALALRSVAVKRLLGESVANGQATPDVAPSVKSYRRENLKRKAGTGWPYG